MEETTTAILYPTPMMVVYDTLINMRHSIHKLQSWYYVTGWRQLRELMFVAVIVGVVSWAI